MTLIDFKTADGIATLTLNRPDKMNAISDELRTQLIDTLDAVSRDDSVRVLVLTGAGKGFCAGGDIAGMKGRMEAPEGERGFNGWKRQLRVHADEKESEGPASFGLVGSAAANADSLGT